MTPRRISPDDPDLPAMHALIHRCFAGMEGRVDPPSSVHRLTLKALKAQARDAELWALPDACMILAPKADTLYLGKLAVDAAARGQGRARQLITWAKTRARALQKTSLTLETRIELTENHAIFRALGFRETARTAHPGFDRPTSITFTLLL
ncbi:GNAT family N-acetyltransferase [Yoonia sp. R2331]|uniref:GNAT family N-acetyltransferase n=1 Tax=Yoonia sp. R2331 TaxID=3237238 RepID=UPI0034E57608